MPDAVDTINPGVVEDCGDGIDNDCDGYVDGVPDATCEDWDDSTEDYMCGGSCNFIDIIDQVNWFYCAGNSVYSTCLGPGGICGGPDINHNGIVEAGITDPDWYIWYEEFGRTDCAPVVGNDFCNYADVNRDGEITTVNRDDFILSANDGRICRKEMDPAAVCGDANIDLYSGETCDSDSLAGYTDCNSYDSEFSTGDLSCYPNGHAQECTFDISDCEYPTCGEGAILSSCYCDNVFYSSGFCCSNSYELFGCSGEQPLVKFIHMTDTHIIDGGSPTSSAKDGRTDNCGTLKFLGLLDGTLGYPNHYATYCGSNPTGPSTAPEIALTDAITLANTISNVNFNIFTGDLVAEKLFTADKTSSLNTFKSLTDTLDSSQYFLGGFYHDYLIDGSKWDIYETQFSQPMNHDFVLQDSLFIILSEYNDARDYDLTFLENKLEIYKNQNKNVFIFVHEPPVAGFRTYDSLDFQEIVEAHKDDYTAVVVMGGHNHANQYIVKNGIHYITTTATMNYPTEFRIIEIGENAIYMYMSDIFSPEINQVSEDLGDYYINELDGYFGGATKETFVGTEEDRVIYIPIY